MIMQCALKKKEKKESLHVITKKTLMIMVRESGENAKNRHKTTLDTKSEGAEFYLA